MESKRQLTEKQKTILISTISMSVVIGIFFADRFLKEIFIDITTPQPLISGFLEFTKHKNHGLIANLPVEQWLVICFSLVVILFLMSALWRTVKHVKTLQALALSLIIGGALGNLYDRIALGYVFDWLLLFRTSIINLADISIFMGILLYLTSIKKNFPIQQKAA